MWTKLGIIPAAGKASRWGGCFKELLPIGHNKYTIDCSINAMVNAGVSRFCIVTNQQKIGAHVEHFRKEKYKDLDIFFTIQEGENDIWSAWKTGMKFREDSNYFSFPDTIFDENSFLEDSTNPISLGIHFTKMPERFGVIVQNRVINKEAMKGEFMAWGNLIISRVGCDILLDREIKDYTDAINNLMDIGYTTYDISPYTDFASWEDYRKFINEYTDTSKAL